MNIDKFLGLYLIAGDRPPGALDLADDVRITSRGSCERRPGLRRSVDLPAASTGLYSVDDTLRTVAPNGTSGAGLFPNVLLDLVDAPSVHGRVQSVRLASGRRALWIEHVGAADGPAGIHITNRLPGIDETGSGVTLTGGFLEASAGLIGLYGRLWTIDKARNVLRFSGTDSPSKNDGKGYVTQWDDHSDTTDVLAELGGFISLGQGSSEPLGLAEYRGRVCVFLRTQIQTWLPGPDGVDSLDQTVSGPGTRFPGTIASVSGDLLYADAGARIRTLGTDSATEGAQEGSVGEGVAVLSRELILPGGNPPVGIYARGLSCYLVGSGTTLLCLSLTPGGEVHGWSRWNLPLPAPISALTESAGITYIRAGDAVWYFDANAQNDETSLGVYQGITPDVILADIPTAGSDSRGTQPPTIQKLGVIIRGGVGLVSPITEGTQRTEAPMQPKAPSPTWRSGTYPCWRFAVRMRCVDAPAGQSFDGMILE